MKNDYLISIIIPSKNRQRYLVETCKQILQLKSDKIEVVIHDNSEKGLNNTDLEKISSPNLKYVHNSDNLSFTENFNKAIELSTGEYLCLIGDDDGVLPEIVLIADWAKKNNIDSISSRLRFSYYWPSSKIPTIKNDNGNLLIEKFSSNVKKYYQNIELNKFFKNGAINYLSYGLVRLYHGLVHKKALEKVKRLTGIYIGGLSPDIYSSIILSMTIEYSIVIDYPFTIPGVCGSSGSSDSVRGRHTGEFITAPHLNGHKNYSWSFNVPKFYSVDTIWSDSAFAAIINLKRNDLFKKFNFEFFTLFLLLKYKNYKGIILNNYLNNKRKSASNILNVLTFIRYVTIKIISKIINIIFKKKVKKYISVKDINQAALIIKNNIHNNEISKNKLIKNLNNVIFKNKKDKK